MLVPQKAEDALRSDGLTTPSTCLIHSRKGCPGRRCHMVEESHCHICSLALNGTFSLGSTRQESWPLSNLPASWLLSCGPLCLRFPLYSSAAGGHVCTWALPTSPKLTSSLPACQVFSVPDFSFPNLNYFPIFSDWEDSCKSLENWFCCENQLPWLHWTLIATRPQHSGAEQWMALSNGTCLHPS